MPLLTKPEDVAAEIDDIVESIAARFRPEQVILFGSRARVTQTD
jgi:hypothetical protein